MVHHNVAALPTRLGIGGPGAGASRAVFVFSVTQAAIVIVEPVHSILFSVAACCAHLAVPIFPGRTGCRRRSIVLAGLGVLEA